MPKCVGQNKDPTRGGDTYKQTERARKVNGPSIVDNTGARKESDGVEAAVLALAQLQKQLSHEFTTGSTTTRKTSKESSSAALTPSGATTEQTPSQDDMEKPFSSQCPTIDSSATSSDEQEAQQKMRTNHGDHGVAPRSLDDGDEGVNEADKSSKTLRLSKRYNGAGQNAPDKMDIQDNQISEETNAKVVSSKSSSQSYIVYRCRKYDSDSKCPLFSFSVGELVSTGAADVHGSLPESFSLTPPELPLGLHFDECSGMIAGLIPLSSEAVFPKKIYRISSHDKWGSASCQIEIEVPGLDPPGNLQYCSSNYIFNLDKEVHISAPTASGTKPDTFTIAPELPADLRFDRNTGQIHGIAHTPWKPTDFTVVAFNEWGNASTKFNLSIPEPRVPWYSCGDDDNEHPVFRFFCGSVASAELVGSSPYDIFAIDCDLPEGLTFDKANGTIGGMIPQLKSMEQPATEYVVSIIRSYGVFHTKISIEIQPLAPPDILRYAQNECCYLLDENVWIEPPTFLGSTPDGFHVVGDLPRGILLNPNNGGFYGNAEVVCDYTISVMAKNQWGTTSTQIRIVVESPKPPKFFGYGKAEIISVFCGDTMLLTPNVKNFDFFTIEPEFPKYICFDERLGTISSVIPATPAAVLDETYYEIKAWNSWGHNKCHLGLEIKPLDSPHGLEIEQRFRTRIYELNSRVKSCAPVCKGTPPTRFDIFPALPPGFEFDNDTGEMYGTALEPAPLTNYCITASNIWGSDSVTTQILVRTPDPPKYANDSYVFSVSDMMLIYPPDTTASNAEPESFEHNGPLEDYFDPTTGGFGGLINDDPNAVMVKETISVTAIYHWGRVALEITVAIMPKPGPRAITIKGNEKYRLRDHVYISPVASNSSLGTTAEHYNLSPAFLPEGLVFDDSNGVVQGAANERWEPTEYTLVAKNIWGSSSAIFILEISLASERIERFHYVQDVFEVVAGTAWSSGVPTCVPSTPHTVFSITPEDTGNLHFDTTNGVFGGLIVNHRDEVGERGFCVRASTAAGSVDTHIKLKVLPRDPPTSFQYEKNEYFFAIGDRITIPHPDATGVKMFHVLEDLTCQCPGLVFDSETGAFDGLAVAPISTTLIVDASNHWGTKSTSFTLNIWKPAAPCAMRFSSSNLMYHVGELVNEKLDVQGDGPFKFVIIPSKLPSGLYFDAHAGILCGIVSDDTCQNSETEVHAFELEATNVTGLATLQFSITLQRPNNTPVRYPTGNFLVGDVVKLEPNYDSLPVHHEFSNATLPKGLYIDPESGVISGIALEETKTGVRFTVCLVTPLNGSVISVEITIAPGRLKLTQYCSKVFSVCVGEFIDTEWELNEEDLTITPELPNGLSMNPTGRIAGIAFEKLARTTYTIQAEKDTSQLLTLDLEFTEPPSCAKPTAWNAPVAETVEAQTTAGPGKINYPHSKTRLFGGVYFTFIAGIPCTTGIPKCNGDNLIFIMTSGNLPPGLFLDPATGQIGGIVPVSVTIPDTEYTLTVCNDHGKSELSFAIDIQKGPTLQAIVYSSSKYLMQPDTPFIIPPPTITGGHASSFVLLTRQPPNLIFCPQNGGFAGFIREGESQTLQVVARNRFGDISTSITVKASPESAISSISYEVGELRRSFIGSRGSWALSLTCGEVVDTGPTQWKGTRPHSYRISAVEDLPAGLYFNSKTGRIAGRIPENVSAVCQAKRLIISAYSRMNSVSLEAQITVLPLSAPNVVYPADMPLRVGSFLFLAPDARNATWFEVNSPLPKGVAFDSRKGIFYGLPSEAQNEPMQVEAHNIWGSTKVAVALNIQPCFAPTEIKYNVLPSFVMGCLQTTGAAEVGKCAARARFSVSPKTLPDGITFDEATGAFVAMPPTAKDFTVSNFTATVALRTRYSITTTDFAISIAPKATPSRLKYNTHHITCEVYKFMRLMPQSCEGSRPNQFFLIPVELPDGLYFDAKCGMLYGTPQEPWNQEYVVKARNEWGMTDTNLGIHIPKPLPPPPIMYLSSEYNLWNQPVFSFYCGTIASTGPAQLATYDVQGKLIFAISPALPPGLKIDPHSGEIAGSISSDPSFVLPRTVYNVTAKSIWGESSTTIELNIKLLPGLTRLEYGFSNRKLNLNENFSLSKPVVESAHMFIGDEDTHIHNPLLTTLTISPQLPNGLVFAHNGCIYGKPLRPFPTTEFTVKCSNRWGSLTTSLRFSCKMPAAPVNLVYYNARNASEQPSFWSSLHYVYHFACGAFADTTAPDVKNANEVTFSIEPELPSYLNLSTTTGRIYGWVPCNPNLVQDEKSYRVLCTSASGECDCNIKIVVGARDMPLRLNYAEESYHVTVGKPLRTLQPEYNSVASQELRDVPTYAVFPATLPRGLIFSPRDGSICGYPLVPTGRMKFTVTASNRWGEVQTLLVITCAAYAPPLSLSYLDAVKSTSSVWKHAPHFAFKCGELVTTGAANCVSEQPVTFAITPELPADLSFCPRTGTIAGYIKACNGNILRAASYVVTASNIWGNCSTAFDIQIMPRKAPMMIQYEKKQYEALLGSFLWIPAPQISKGKRCWFGISPPDVLPTEVVFDTKTGAIFGPVSELMNRNRQAFTISGWNCWGEVSDSVTIDVPTPEIPSSLTYKSKTIHPLWRTPTFTFACGALNETGPAICSGQVEKYAISPSAKLPIGLSFDPVSGNIGGMIPSQHCDLQTTSFTVTASNSWGLARCDIEIAVRSHKIITNKEMSKAIAKELENLKHICHEAGSRNVVPIKSNSDSDASEADVEVRMAYLEVLEKVPMNVNADTWMARTELLLEQFDDVSSLINAGSAFVKTSPSTSRMDATADDTVLGMDISFGVLGLLFESHCWLETLWEKKMRPVWHDITQALKDATTMSRDSQTPASVHAIRQELSDQKRQWNDRFDENLDSVLPNSSKMFMKELSATQQSISQKPTIANWQDVLEKHVEMLNNSLHQLFQTEERLLGFKRLLDTKSSWHTFQEISVQDRLNTTFLSLLATAVCPIPGAMEIWLATTVVMWLETDEAGRHVVVESPDSDPIATLARFGSCPSTRTEVILDRWKSSKVQATCCLIHNATTQFVTVQIREPVDAPGSFQKAINMHPLGRRLVASSDGDVRFTAVLMPGEMEAIPSCFDMDLKPFAHFSYGKRDSLQPSVGSIQIKEGAIFSFCCVDAGIRLCNRGVEAEKLNKFMVTMVNGSNEKAEIKSRQRDSDSNQIPIHLETVLHPGSELMFQLKPPVGHRAQRCLMNNGLVVEVLHRGKTSTCEMLPGQVLKIEAIF
eukprot:GEMP01000069.1.p1 GENE.GEMP01000069.1~~GEMP01000069.1.p1  ORF type:complete len:3256 (+),score=468.64 GEMP01000069.1:314-10081(+)